MLSFFLVRFIQRSHKSSVEKSILLRISVFLILFSSMIILSSTIIPLFLPGITGGGKLGGPPTWQEPGRSVRSPGSAGLSSPEGGGGHRVRVWGEPGVPDGVRGEVQHAVRAAVPDSLLRPVLHRLREWVRHRGGREVRDGLRVTVLHCVWWQVRNSVRWQGNLQII